MIRKAIIVVLTLAAVGMGGVLVWSMSHPSLFYYSWRGWSVRYLRGIDLRSGPDPTFALHLRGWVANLEYGGSCSFVDVPLWVLFLILAAYPTLAFFRGPLRRWRRRRKGLCRKCSYDLTGNESGVCPECGSPIPVDKQG